MKRRDAILAVVAVLASYAAGAQQRRSARIGYLVINSEALDKERVAVFRQGLREQGYVEDRNLQIEFRYGDGDVRRLQGLAEELVRMKVDVIVAGSTPAIQAARNATHTIPIVMATNADPVGMGFVASLARPGGNVTGMSSMMPELAAKRLELIRLILPGVSRVGFLLLRTDPAHKLFLREAHAAAGGMGMQIVPSLVDNADQVESALDAFGRDGIGAIIVQPIFLPHFRRIAERAAKNALPTVSDIQNFAAAGGLVSYGPDALDNYRRTATYIDRILKGAKPAELPVEQPTRFELVINLRTAKSLGLSIPTDLLMRADKVIR